MHERSLVKSLIEQVVEEMASRGIQQITSVQLQLGEFSGIDPTLIGLAFSELAVLTWNSDVRLNLEVVPLTASCGACGAVFHVVNFRFVCSECGEGNVIVTAGEEMRLVSLSVERQPIGN
jgi:hydrogenase nickel incorporation protein HypA/HybF